MADERYRVVLCPRVDWIEIRVDLAAENPSTNLSSRNSSGPLVEV